MAEYPGDSPAKKVARIRLYVRAAKVLRELRVGMHEGYHVVLCGPEGGEIGCLKHILRAPPERCLFVDTSLAGLVEAERRWPGVKVYNGPVGDAFLKMAKANAKCRFIHLDLFGHVNMEAARGVILSKSVLAEKAILAITFLAAREDPNRHPLWRLVQSYVRAFYPALPQSPGTRAILELDPPRMFGYTSILGLLSRQVTPEIAREWERQAEEEVDADLAAMQAAGLTIEEIVAEKKRMQRETAERAYAPILGVKYDSGTSPMGTLAVVHVPIDVSRTTRFREVVFRAPGSETAFRIPEDSMKELLTLIDWMEGIYGIGAACEIANISRGTLAAWRAHRTRGTYDGFGYFLGAV